MIRAYIDGSAGTTGLRIRERLSVRSDVALKVLPEAVKKDPQARREALNSADVAFLCLPDAAAKEAAAMVENPRLRLIDASTAHRVAPGWAYGFPELSAEHRRAVAEGTRVAAPGCYASGFVALIYPLVAAGVLPRDYPLVCHAVSGYSGGGKKMIADYEAGGRSALLDSPRQYALTQAHKHLPEMTTVPGLDRAPIFNPMVGDYYSGMTVTVPLYPELLRGRPGIAALHQLLTAHYAGQTLVRVLPLGGGESTADGFLAGNRMAGSDAMELLIAGNDERALLCASFDNLGKGASGAAIQCMNIMFGIDETTGLTV